MYVLADTTRLLNLGLNGLKRNDPFWGTVFLRKYERAALVRVWCKYSSLMPVFYYFFTVTPALTQWRKKYCLNFILRSCKHVLCFKEVWFLRHTKNWKYKIISWINLSSKLKTNINCRLSNYLLYKLLKEQNYTQFSFTQKWLGFGIVVLSVCCVERKTIIVKQVKPNPLLPYLMM